MEAAGRISFTFHDDISSIKIKGESFDLSPGKELQKDIVIDGKSYKGAFRLEEGLYLTKTKKDDGSFKLTLHSHQGDGDTKATNLSEYQFKTTNAKAVALRVQGEALSRESKLTDDSAKFMFKQGQLHQSQTGKEWQPLNTTPTLQRRLAESRLEQRFTKAHLPDVQLKGSGLEKAKSLQQRATAGTLTKTEVQTLGTLLRALGRKQKGEALGAMKKLGLLDEGDKLIQDPKVKKEELQAKSKPSIELVVDHPLAKKEDHPPLNKSGSHDPPVIEFEPLPKPSLLGSDKSLLDEDDSRPLLQNSDQPKRSSSKLEQQVTIEMSDLSSKEPMVEKFGDFEIIEDYIPLDSEPKSPELLRPPFSSSASWVKNLGFKPQDLRGDRSLADCCRTMREAIGKRENKKDDQRAVTQNLSDALEALERFDEGMRAALDPKNPDTPALSELEQHLQNFEQALAKDDRISTKLFASSGRNQLLDDLRQMKGGLVSQGKEQLSRMKEDPAYMMRFCENKLQKMRTQVGQLESALEKMPEASETEKNLKRIWPSFQPPTDRLRQLLPREQKKLERFEQFLDGVKKEDPKGLAKALEPLAEGLGQQDLSKRISLANRPRDFVFLAAVRNQAAKHLEAKISSPQKEALSNQISRLRQPQVPRSAIEDLGKTLAGLEERQREVEQLKKEVEEVDSSLPLDEKDVGNKPVTDLFLERSEELDDMKKELDTTPLDLGEVQTEQLKKIRLRLNELRQQISEDL